jgi:hypothetical protein
MNHDLRNKLGNYEPSYNPQHWEQLSQRLAKANQKRRFSYAIAASLLLFIGAGLGYFCYQFHKNKQQSSNNLTNLINENIIANQNSSTTTNAIQKDTIISNSKISKNVVETSKFVVEIVENNVVNNATNKKLPNTKKLATLLPKNENTATKKVTKNSKSDKQYSQNSIISKPNSQNKLKNKLKNTSKSSQNLRDSLPQNHIINTINSQELLKLDTFSFITTTKELRFSTSNWDTLKPKFAYYRINENNVINQDSAKGKALFRIGATTLPMIAVWKNEHDKEALQGFMINTGLIAEYRLNNFVLGGGILLSNYSLSSPKEKSLDLNIDSTYSVNTYLTSQQQIKELLIPISLRYDFKTNLDSYWFITANILNSFIISDNQRQTTTTEYNNNLANISGENSKVAYYENNQTKNNTFQPFSALQLQVGYEKMLSKHFSFQIEPFARLSLQSHNNQMQSYAAGISLRINYMN